MAKALADPDRLPPLALVASGCTPSHEVQGAHSLREPVRPGRQASVRLPEPAGTGDLGARATWWGQKLCWQPFHARSRRPPHRSALEGEIGQFCLCASAWALSVAKSSVAKSGARSRCHDPDNLGIQRPWSPILPCSEKAVSVCSQRYLAWSLPGPRVADRARLENPGRPQRLDPDARSPRVPGDEMWQSSVLNSEAIAVFGKLTHIRPCRVTVEGVFAVPSTRDPG
jgi:hypothetical protein